MRMNRRQAVQRLGILVGGTLSASTLAGVLGGCQAPHSTTWHPQVLSKAQNESLIALTDRMVPETDTPGAKAALVNRFIDSMLAEWHTDGYRQRFLEGLDDVSARANQSYGAAFTTLASAQQDEIVATLAIEARGDGEAFFSMLKEQTLVGYYTSEIGASQELRYLQIPGRYAGCVPLEEVGRAWSTLSSA